VTWKISFGAISLSEAINLLLEDLALRKSSSYFFINAYSISLTDKNPAYRELLQNNNRNLIDGKPIELLLNKYQKSKKRYHQIRGADFTREILRTFPKSKSIFLLGGSVQNLIHLSEIIGKKYPNVKISGTFSPSYELDWPSYIDSVVEMIDTAQSSLVFVSLGTPKQDFVAKEISSRLNLVAVSIGAALDFITFNISECPKWMQFIGLEWFFRLVVEPQRLWRRYLIESPKLIKLFLLRRI